MSLELYKVGTNLFLDKVIPRHSKDLDSVNPDTLC